MGQKQAAYDATGAIFAFYDTVDSPAPQGTAVIDITDAEWQFCVNNQRSKIVSNGALIDAPPVIVPLADIKSGLVQGIDNLVASIYSQWTRFQQEYLERQAAAQAFKDAGYTGDPGVWVSAFATAAGITNQQATDLIMAQSTSLNGALATLGALRMRKYEIINAADADAANAAYADITAKINQTAEAIQ
jgi:hypothetical protein